MDDNLRRSGRIIKRKYKEIIETNDCRTQVIKNSDQIKGQTKRREKWICEKCSSNEVIKKSNKSKIKTSFDPISQKWIKVCNNCAKLKTRSNKVTDISTKISIEEQKRKYLSNCHSFGLSLVQLLNDSSAERLFCPNLRTTGKACACLQRYVIGSDDNLSEKQQRAQHLLDLLTKAKRLSRQKCYSMSNPKSGQKIGLGNGHKKSKEFEDFINNERNVLRNDYKFCEKAVQRVLFYSNNFLHKKLKTEPMDRQRVERKNGKAFTQKLIEISLLADNYCCVNRCVDLSQTRPQLLQHWRQRAATGQLEARRVLAEMLTPTQAIRSNCLKFVSLVTGSSIRTISKVNEYLKTNGGNKEPKEHGLKRFPVINDKRHSIKHMNTCNQDMQKSSNGSDNGFPTESSLSFPTIISSIDSVQQNDNRIALIVNQTNNEISVINSGKKQTIAILSPRINLISNTGHTLQIPVSITSQII